MAAAELIAVVILGYLLGSIPFGVILTRAAGAGDLRSMGSGSTGATNVLRTGRKGLAAATLALDLLKGVAAVLLARAVWPGDEAWAATAAVVGHCYPVWLRFQGGKGVATLMGVVTALAWAVGLVFAVTWLSVLAIGRISSLAGMAAAISVPIAALLLGQKDYLPALVVLAVFVLWRHRSNIARLRAGTEPRLGSKN